MRYTVTPAEGRVQAIPGYTAGYFDPLSGVLANHVYNALLNGRPYFLQPVEDGEIAVRFTRERLGMGDVSVTAPDRAFTVAAAIPEVVAGVRLAKTRGVSRLSWFDLVDGKQEAWPIEYLLPNGAYVH